MGKYISNFETTLEYTAYTASTEFVTPNVSLCKDENKVHYSPIDFSKRYLTFVAKENGTFTLTIGSAVTTSILSSISYSLDKGKTWVTTNNVNDQTVTITTPTINQGKKVLWKGNGVGVSTTTNNSNRPSTSSIFSSSGEFDVEGNILSLIYGDEFIGKDYAPQGSSYNFALLFYANTSHVGNNYARVVSAKNMCLPIKDTPTCCYFRMFQESAGATANNTLTTAPSKIDAESVGASACTSMFYDCTSLTTAPELLATTLANRCCYSMFANCASLTIAPELLATTLAPSCYYAMFVGCTNLVKAPSSIGSSATTMAPSACTYMFQSCTNLTVAPQLLATTLAEKCYASMFIHCTSLTVAPSSIGDSSTTMAISACTSMFSDCTSLTTAPELPATTLANNCYQQMFHDCTSLTTAPTLSATTLANYCYYGMFYGCASLNSITCLATNISATECTNGWVNGVASSGTFTKAPSMSSWTSGNNGIPTNWSVVDAS